MNTYVDESSIAFSLELVWSQISLFDANLRDPFNDWTQEHLDQGFSWRPGSVSFKTPLRHGEIDVRVEIVRDIVVRRDAQWAIVVPFTNWGGLIEISSIAGSEVIDLPSGRYALLFQTGVKNGRSWCTFGLLDSPMTPVEPVILKSDRSLNPPDPLLMEAEPAA